jgi:hypothetical protein
MHNKYLSRYSSVSTVTRKGTKQLIDHDRIPGKGKTFFSSSKIPDLLKGPPTCQSLGTGAPPLGVKRPGCETDHLPSSNIDFKVSGGICRSPRIFIACQGRVDLYLYNQNLPLPIIIVSLSRTRLVLRQI